MQRHVEWLIVESTKKRPNYEEVASRMQLTFPQRRNSIINGEFPTTLQVQKTYPWLFKDEGEEVGTLADSFVVVGGQLHLSL